MNPPELLFHAVVDTSWRASFLILLLLGLRQWARGRVSARLLYWVWLAVSLRLLLPVSVPAAWSPFNFASWSRVSGYAVNPLARFDFDPAEIALPKAAATSSSVTNAALVSASGLSLGGWLALVWAGGVAALLFLRVWASTRFTRAVVRSAMPPSPVAAALVAEAWRSLNTSGVRVLVTDTVSAPALHGVVRPRILFPPGFLEKLSPTEVRLVLAHEWAHVRRRDLLADAITHLAVALHWFNPLVWLAARIGRHDCELACDESVLREGTDTQRESYGAALLRIARLATEAPGLDFTLGVVASKGQLKRRIQMIMANKTFTLSGTLLGSAVAIAFTGLSFTSEITAQTPALNAEVAAPQSSSAAVPLSNPSNIEYNASIDRLDVLFPTGVVATVGDRTIMVADVRSYIGPLVPELQQRARTQEEFNEQLTRLQNSAIKNLVDRSLLIRQFRDDKPGGQAKQISTEHIDAYIADRITGEFGGDRSKFLEYLRGKGQTMRDYRKEVEDDIIYNYMRAQERKAAAPASSTVSLPATRPLRLRMIQLTRSEGETDAAITEKANAVVARFRSGESFEALAKELDQSKRRERGGDWGWMGESDLRVEYRDAILALKKGEVSAPILTKDVCILVYMEDRR